MDKQSFRTVIALLLAAGVCLLGYIAYTGGLGAGSNSPQPVVESSGLLKTEKEFRDKLTELNIDRHEVKKGLEKLNIDKAKCIAKLKKLGIGSGDDYLNSQKDEVKREVSNLNQYVAKIKQIEKQSKHYDDAISAITVMLDKIERERISDSISMSEAQSEEIRTIIIDLDERLEVKTDMFEEQELKKLLDLEMTDDGES